MATSKHPNLASALIAAQSEFSPITKDNTIKQSGVSKQGKAYNLTYKYADLGSVLEAVTPALHANGLVISQPVDLHDGQPCVKTVLMHAESEKELVSYTPIIWADKSDPQKFGGGITYSRRYALMAMLNLNAEDDDGNHAREPRPQPRKEPEQFVDTTTGEIEEPTPRYDADEARASNRMATEKQVGAIYGIATKKGYDREEVHALIDKRYSAQSTKDLTVDQASDMIDFLQGKAS